MGYIRVNGLPHRVFVTRFFKLIIVIYVLLTGYLDLNG